MDASADPLHTLDADGTSVHVETMRDLVASERIVDRMALVAHDLAASCG